MAVVGQIGLSVDLSGLFQLFALFGVGLLGSLFVLLSAIDLTAKPRRLREAKVLSAIACLLCSVSTAICVWRAWPLYWFIILELSSVAVSICILAKRIQLSCNEDQSIV